ncbi:MAG: glutamine synthetase type III [Ruminococcaceae bacterium]|nr:glutamine synthetase type III [Oscillospiraceae bacterium]
MTENKLRMPELFGSDVFSEAVMKTKLPKATFKELMKVIHGDAELTLPVAEVVASAMKDWAVEKGATHYAHWFQPMTGITAEKHDSFISPVGDGTAIMEFSGKELIKGEPDASSFPSGGLRATFEARGYTAWDPTSYAFIKDNALYIPTAFFSYSGEALDKKTPLLRSMDAVSKQTVRILRLFGNEEVNAAIATVGAEQEYFLVDKKSYDKRKDLIFTGRTLFGAAPVKGQELEDHYFGTIKQRVGNYMEDLDRHLWALGVASKTKHNEAAPAQHECAPIFESANLAADHNQLTMEIMKKVALEHGMVCLLHEKPFQGVNGSGKHDNWSLTTDDGHNLLNPGKSPMENAQFLTFLVAIIKAVDEHADLLRVSVATAGNDHRLGGNEAPPAIVSIFLGDELTEIINAIVDDKDVESKRSQFDIGISTLPKFPKDTTDRNRTSPFAFTGNKFEFRSVGSSLNISDPNIVLNTIVAEALDEFATELEGAEDFTTALHELLVRTIKKHKRVIFNGNGYDDAWVKEATEIRGLPCYNSAVDAIPHFRDEKNIKLFAKHKVFTEVEVNSRTEIQLENYCKIINIEALTTVEMASKEILPAVMEYERALCETLLAKKSAGIGYSVESNLASSISVLAEDLNNKIYELEAVIIKAHGISDIFEAARCYHDEVFATMQALRAIADQLETMVAEKYWPFPTYEELLFNV